MDLLRRQTESTPTASSTPTPTPTPSSTPNYRTSSSTPYLFFIALGIGVVFTNIWLIIGIRYYFRRRRNAAFFDPSQQSQDMSGNNNNGQFVYQGNGIYLQQVRRRRAPRKLLTLDQLDALFPIRKYRDWAAQQKQHGLPTEGGISTSAAQALEKSLVQQNTESTELDAPNTSHTSENCDAAAKSPPLTESAEVAPATTLSDDEEEHRHFTPDESGDTCAICIDALEPDDDIRGLECHHVFHADCITPWLTTRRALCPLCKRDYFQGPSDEQEGAAEHEGAATAVPENASPSTAGRASPTAMQRGRRRLSNSSAGTTRHVIGSTGVTYEAENTPIYDEIRDLMARIRRARAHRREQRRRGSHAAPSSDEDRGAELSPPPSPGPGTPPRATTAQLPATPPQAAAAATGEAGRGGVWRFWRNRTAAVSQV